MSIQKRMCTEKLFDTYRAMFGVGIKGIMGQLSTATEEIICTLFVEQKTPCAGFKVEFGAFWKRREGTQKIKDGLHF